MSSVVDDSGHLEVSTFIIRGPFRQYRDYETKQGFDVNFVLLYFDGVTCHTKSVHWTTKENQLVL